MIWGLLGLFLVLMLLVLGLQRLGMLRFVPIVIGVFIAILALTIWMQNARKDHASRDFAEGDIELVDVQFDERTRGNHSISGRIRNKSQETTLDELHLRVTLSDCVDAVCDTVDQTELVLRTDVPPVQSRDFREVLVFRSLVEPRGQFKLNYEILATRAK